MEEELTKNSGKNQEIEAKFPVKDLRKIRELLELPEFYSWEKIKTL